MQRTVLILALATLCSPAMAQRSRAQTAPAPITGKTDLTPSTGGAASPGTGAPGAAGANEPKRTTASFGDWVMRCVRAQGQPARCEVDQVVAKEGKPVAQTALGRPRAGETMMMTIVVPLSVSLATQPRLVGTDVDTGFAPISLTWRKCVPQGCIADTSLTDEQVRRLQSRTENARVLFQDAAGREATLPFGPRGLAQALEALAKEG